MTFCQWYPILERTVSCNWSFKGTLSPKTFLAYLNVLPQGIFDPFFKSFKISFLLWFLFPGGIVLWGQTPFCMEADCQRSGFFNSWLVLAGIAGGCHVWLNISLQWWTCKACHSGSSSFRVALCSGGPWTRGCLYKNNPLMDPLFFMGGVIYHQPFSFIPTSSFSCVIRGTTIQLLFCLLVIIKWWHCWLLNSLCGH